MWFVRQLFYLIADVVDQSLFDHGWTSDLAKDAFQPRKFQRKDADKEEVKILGLADRKEGESHTELREKRCVADEAGSAVVGKCFLGSRRHFADQLHVSTAVDAARIGDVEALCGMLLGGPLGDQRACWMAPQVDSGGVLSTPGRCAR